MKKKKIQLLKNILLFILSGVTFNAIEISIRFFSNQLEGLCVGYNMQISAASLCAYTSLWMTIVGGTCGIFLGKLNQWNCTRVLPMWLQCLIGTIFILALEFQSGYILNSTLHLGIWDYSNQLLNLYGQICLKMGLSFYFMSPAFFWVEEVFYLYINKKRTIDKNPLYYYKLLFTGK